MSEGGVSAAYVNSAISSLRSELLGEINQVRRELRSEIARLEAEMREIGAMIVRAIEHQTRIIEAGVVATTTELEVTRAAMGEDFSRTRAKLDTQIESVLQIEVGKKVADATSLKAKLRAFVSDIKSRFDRSILGVAQNRELYNVTFRKLIEEYESKIRSIGAHIFEIRTEDIAPAVRAAAISYEQVHTLPIEMDLHRLAVRSASLDETLGLLKSSPLDEVLSSIDIVSAQVDSFAMKSVSPIESGSFCVEGLVTVSELSSKVLVGNQALTVDESRQINLRSTDPDLNLYAENVGDVLPLVANVEARSLRADEIVGLANAATALESSQLISSEALALFRDFLASGNLKYVEV